MTGVTRQRKQGKRRRGLAGRGRQARPDGQRWASIDPSEILVIEPRQLGSIQRFTEVWRYRRLVPFFGRKALEKTYRKTKLGWLWVPLRPVLDVTSRVLIFGGLLGVPSEGVPYFLFFLVGMGAWRFFSRSLLWLTRSVELNSKYLKKLYFPRLILPVSSYLPAIVEYGVYTVFFLVALVFYRLRDGLWYLGLGPELLLLPAGLFLAAALAFGIGMFTSIFGTYGRDTRWTLGYVTSFWFFLTPVIYPLSLVPDEYQTAMTLNPMVAPVEMVKSSLLGVGDVTGVALASCLVVSATVLTLGLWYFGRSEAAAVDGL